MKRILILMLLAIFLSTSLALGAVKKKPSRTKPAAVKTEKKKEESKIVTKSNVHLIDDFSDGNYTANPEWWKFDRINVEVVPNDPAEKKEFTFLGKNSILLEGSTVNWYIGGLGTYLGLEGSKYDGIRLVVFGNGPGSGALKIELYDDDNKNWDVDVDLAKGYDPIADDKFTYTIDVNWKGWKVISVPFFDFEDENPDVGDDIWNPSQKDGSGGLLQVQLICLSSSKAVGKMDLKIAALKLYKN